MPNTLPVTPLKSKDPFLLPTSVLEAELIVSVVAQTASIHTQLHLLVACDERGAWVGNGSTSSAVWWAETAGIELSTARDQLRVTRALLKYEPLDLALEEQRLSYAKVRYLARYVNGDNVNDLIEIAERVPAGRLGYALASYWNSESSSDEVSARQHANRSVSWKTDADGMMVITSRLPPIDGAHLTSLIDSESMRGNTVADDMVGQQRADGLMTLLTSSTNGDDQGSVRAEIVVHVTANEHGGLIHALQDGTPLPEAQASELLCGASIRAIVHDSKGQPIDASPAAPSASKRQRRLLMARDKHCQYRGCRATMFLHAHHIGFRENGGPTIIANLVVVCSFHHRHIHTHDTGWRPSWKA